MCALRARNHKVTGHRPGIMVLEPELDIFSQRDVVRAICHHSQGPVMSSQNQLVGADREPVGLNKLCIR